MTIAPEVLDSAATDPTSPAWDRIWRESGDQGSFAPASAALLPWLARTCAAFAPRDRERAVVLAGFIALDATDADRAVYADQVAALRALAVECLSVASTDDMFVQLQQAVAGFDGDEIWGRELDRVNAGEVDVQCPDCDEELLVDLRRGHAVIEPGLPSELARRLHAEAVQAGRESVAAALTRLFGRFSCSECGAGFVLADHLAGVSDR
ncbi:hypothetical protein [Plantactinospora sp. B24E8]|uniref:hypothetical protein n=1 Tax=Plantactinospora sp. B24E8 TaxID=3153567 RepID=UPI00325DD970